MNTDPAEQYREEISKYEPLPEEVEERLLRVIQKSGNDEARRIVAKHKLQLVFTVSRTYQNLLSEVPFIDIVDQGNLGLFRAIDELCTSEGDEEFDGFTDYATAWIRQAIESKYFGMY